ncbi:MAG: hypothetical protein V4573_20725 [Pseudomonadota bacterium]
MPFASQPRGAGRRHVFAMLLIATVLAAVMYQGKGYPEEDSVDGKRMTAAEHIARLNAFGDAVPREMRHRVVLKDSCTLEFISMRRSAEGQAFDVPLLSLEASSRTDRETGLVLVLIGSLDGPDAPQHEVYQTDRWHEAISYRSHLHQLMRLCAETLRKDEPGGHAGF